MASNLSQTESTTSIGNKPDAFDKALALTTALADRERESSTRSYDRFFQLVNTQL